MFCRPIAVALTGVLALGLFFAPAADAAAKTKSPRKSKVSVKDSAPIPDAREVELFDAIEAGEIEARVVPRHQFGANVYIENKTDEPLNIKFPKAVVAAPILAQFGGGGGMMGGGGGGSMGGGGMGGGGGGGQSMGGGMGGGGMGGGGMGGGGGGMGGGGGGGFFSVAPEKIVYVPLRTVCLEHGKPDPDSRMKYKLVPIEAFTKNTALIELLAMVGTGKLDRNASQAAAWHMTDGMSWYALATKQQQQISGVMAPYFSQNDLVGAQKLLVAAFERAKQNADDTTDGEKPRDIPVRSPRVTQLNR